jgi:predicted glycosyltransferase
LRIWYDACTGKQVRYATAIAQRLRKSGHEFVFTTREHPDTIPLAQILGEKPIVVVAAVGDFILENDGG